MSPQYPVTTQEQLCNQEGYTASQAVSAQIQSQIDQGLSGLGSALGQIGGGDSQRAYNNAKSSCMIRAGYSLTRVCVSNCNTSSANSSTRNTTVSPAAAAYKKGVAAYNRGDYEAARAELEPLAEQGHLAAQYSLEAMSENGYGTQQAVDTSPMIGASANLNKGDYNKATEAYNNGDYASALAEFEPLASQGNISAQYHIGFMYENGMAVRQDYVHAHMWYSVAASNGDAGAARNRTFIQDSMTPSQIEQAQEMARNCLNSGYTDC
jgi:TolA-binding protein